MICVSLGGHACHYLYDIYVVQLLLYTSKYFLAGDSWMQFSMFLLLYTTPKECYLKCIGIIYIKPVAQHVTEVGGGGAEAV